MSPKDHLIALARRHPGLWREVDEIRGRMAHTWPVWCYMPAPAWAVAIGGGRAAPITDVGSTLESGLAAALGTWRMTQGIYRFDAEVYAALVDTPVTGDIPIDVLYRLPEWCVYVETPGMTYRGEGDLKPLAGAWLHLDYGHKTGLTKLRAVLDAGDDLIPVGCTLTGSLQDSLDAALSVSALHIGQHGDVMPDLQAAAGSLRAVLAPLVSLALYLCSDDAEFDAGRPSNPQPKRTKQGWRLFQAEKTTAWNVGTRIGAALRRARYASNAGGADEAGEADGRSRPRAHVRRAHWHTFLAGAGRAERRIKWLPPIPVNVSDVDTMPAVVRPVQ